MSLHFDSVASIQWIIYRQLLLFSLVSSLFLHFLSRAHSDFFFTCLQCYQELFLISSCQVFIPLSTVYCSAFPGHRRIPSNPCQTFTGKMFESSHHDKGSSFPSHSSKKYPKVPHININPFVLPWVSEIGFGGYVELCYVEYHSQSGIAASRLAASSHHCLFWQHPSCSTKMPYNRFWLIHCLHRVFGHLSIPWQPIQHDSHRKMWCADKPQTMGAYGVGVFVPREFTCTCWQGHSEGSSFLSGGFIWQNITSFRDGTITPVGCQWCQALGRLGCIQPAERIPKSRQEIALQK